MSRRWGYPIAVLLALPALLPSQVVAAKPLFLGVAEHSIAAAQHATGSTTAFAYGTEGGVVTAASKGSIHMITSTGATASGEFSTSRDGLSVAYVSALPLRALVATHATSVSGRTPKYVLGPPLGYEGGRIRSVRMPTVQLNGSKLQRITGSMPAKFLGAPVVTLHGRLIGAVAGVGARSWEFAPLGVVEELTAAHHNSAGVPTVPIIVGGLLVILAGMAFGILRIKRRRNRELDLRVRQSRARGAERRAQGPLVRLRAPSEEEEPTKEGNDEDFEVIVKPRREDT